MWRKVSLVLLLAFLLTLPAYCGFQWAKGSSSGSSENYSMTIESTTPAQTQSSSEAMSAENQTEKLSKNSSDSSEKSAEAVVEYDVATADYGALLEEAKASLKKEQEQALVDKLIVSKAVADEQFYILAEESKKKDEIIKELENETGGVHFAFGVSLGYKYPSILTPGVDMQMRAGSWILQTGINYEVDALGGVSQFTDFDPGKIETRVGVLYEF